MSNKRDKQNFEYDVCLSFAGEDRDYVEEVTNHLIDAGVRVFYDEYERAKLWGKDLYTHLDDVYQNAAKYCVVFISKNYARKLWTNHERQSAQARAFRENREYILPARFDKTKIPGIRDTIGYLDLGEISANNLAQLIIEKLDLTPRVNFMPSVPDRLFERLKIEDDEAKEKVYHWACGLIDVLAKMSLDERKVVASFLAWGCTCELAENMHIELGYLSRHTGFSKSKLKKILGAIGSLRFYCSMRAEKEDEGKRLGNIETVNLEWQWISDTYGGGNLTALGHAMIRGVLEGLCEKHGEEAIQRLDFSRLSSKAATDAKEC